MPKALTNLICFLLLGALLPMPYGYFQFLRLVVFAAFSFAAFVAINKNSSIKALVFGSIAFLFNPIYPISFDRDVWMLIDLAVAAILFANRAELARKNL